MLLTLNTKKKNGQPNNTAKKNLNIIFKLFNNYHEKGFTFFLYVVLL